MCSLCEPLDSTGSFPGTGVGDGKLEIGSIDPGYANGESKDRDGEKPFIPLGIIGH